MGAASVDYSAATVTSIAELDALYGPAVEASIVKEANWVTPEYQRFVEAAPFVALATSGPEGMDCSPRGDGPGFVRVADGKTIMIPDRRGNNRIDSLRNIVTDPRVGLLFLIPGIGETLRINGRAAIVTDPALCESFTVEGKAPRSVIVITVDSVYFQCGKAIIRSRLWHADAQIERKTLPSAGQILAAMSENRVGGEAYDQAYPERLKATLY
jgi:PPOX class probable FMN-dependent enzyme